MSLLIIFVSFTINSILPRLLLHDGVDASLGDFVCVYSIGMVELYRGCYFLSLRISLFSVVDSLRLFLFPYLPSFCVKLSHSRSGFLLALELSV